MNLRRSINDLSIRRKLLYGLVATCMATLVLVCSALYWFQSVNFRNSFSAELQSLGIIIAHNSAAPLAANDHTAAVEVLNSLRVMPHITGSIYDRSGNLFATMEGAKPEDETQATEASGVIFSVGHASLSLPVKLQGRRFGHLYLRAEFTDQYRYLLALYALVLAVVLAASLIVVVLISSFLQRVITAPIVALAGVARSISEREDYSARASEHGNDEVGLLTRTFNRMLEQIQSRDRRLRESERRYAIAVMGSSDGLWDLDFAGNTLYFSPRWKSMLGYADAELPNTAETFRRILHPEEEHRVLALVETYLASTEVSYQAEFRALHKDGQPRWILSRGAALRDEHGKPVRFAGSHTDITDRKHAEEELRLAHAKFESLVNSIRGIVWEADPETLQMLFVSDQAEAILGYPAQSWLEDLHFWEKSIHPEDRALALEERRQGLATGQPYEMEFRTLARDGRIVWLRESVSVFREGGHPARLRGLAIDITEQKLAAQEIARMQRELVDASRLAGMAEIATGVLHSIGNVLNHVNISTGLIVDQIRQSKSASLAKAVQLLREHKDQLGEYLTSDAKGQKLPDFLAAVSERIDQEQASLIAETQTLQQNIEHIKRIVAMQQAHTLVPGVLENLSPRDLLEDALRVAVIAPSGQQVEVVREFKPGPLVLVDRHKASQILVTLLNNAGQALATRAEGARLVLSINPATTKGVRIGVKDNGVGIRKEDLTRIFSHDVTIKRTSPGFGLHGGAIAAKEMGGSLEVQSEGLGHGACFILHLPVRESVVPPPLLPQRLEAFVSSIAA